MISHFSKGKTVIGPGANILLQRRDGVTERILQRAIIFAGSSNQFTCELVDQDFALEAGQEIEILYSLGGKFVKQRARITEPRTEFVEQNICRLLTEIEVLGVPTSAEDRQCFRISIAAEKLAIAFGQRLDCPLVDISPTGFGVISPESFVVDALVAATLRYEAVRETGNVQIQRVHELRDGRFRYGVRCIDHRLRAAVERISIALQRLQLRRLAGKAR